MLSDKYFIQWTGQEM